MSVTPSSSSNHSFILRFLFLLALPLVLTTLGSAYLFSVMQKNTLLNTMRFLMTVLASNGITRYLLSNDK